MNDKLKKIVNNTKTALKEKKIIILLVFVLIIIFASTIIILFRSRIVSGTNIGPTNNIGKNGVNANENVNTNSNSKNSFNPFSNFFNSSSPDASVTSKENNTSSNLGSTHNTTTGNTNKTNSSSKNGSSQNGISAPNTPIGQQLGGNPQGSNGGNSSVEQSISIVFKAPDGTLQTYISPTSAPIQVEWARYIDTNDHYAIDYPSNWQLSKKDANGHNGISLFLPGANTNDPNQQYIGFGFSNYNLFPANSSSQDNYATAIIENYLSGTLYTHGVIGQSYIISIFPYNGGYFGVGSTASDQSFAYVYNHMLGSLDFNVK